MRPLLARYPKATMALLLEWSRDENLRVRRLASECMRIRLPWLRNKPWYWIILRISPLF